MTTTPRAVFLDRDGVLNEAVVREGLPHPPASPDEVRMLPGAADACHRLRADGWLLVVVTNQPDIARGTLTAAEVDAINERVTADLGVTDVLVCPHDDHHGCRCRKPAPGMIDEAVGRWGIDVGASVIVGDRWRDVECGRRAGTITVFVDHHYREPRPDAPDHVVASLADAVPLLQRTERTR